MYLYESHMGGIYASNYEIDYEDLYCEQCGDSDNYIGYANTKEEAIKLLIPMTDSDYCSWSKEYVKEFVNENFV